MTIEILSNGSKWAGQEPDSIEQLIEVLKTNDLDLRSFAAFGFISFEENNGYTEIDFEEHNIRIYGNFAKLSHVFNIKGVYKDLQHLINAIESNISRQCDRLDV